MNKVYVSSTYSDLVEFRRAVYDVLRKMRYDVIAMEDYLSTDERPLDKCLNDVASCDAYVGIFAWRCGYIPPGQTRGITELEYRRAGESDIPRFIFLLHEDAPWPPSKVERGSRAESIEKLRAELMKNHVVQFFTSPEDLAAKVAATIGTQSNKRLESVMEDLRSQKILEDQVRRKRRETQRIVNVPPIAVDNFRGRDHEINTFYKQIGEPTVRMICIAGRGGMGKTALACYILSKLEKGKLPAPDEGKEQDIDGILYFSAVSTGLGLERIFTDVGRMLGKPGESILAARWANPQLPLPEKVQYLLEVLSHGTYIMLLDNMETELNPAGTVKDEGLRIFLEQCLTQPCCLRLVVTSREMLKIPPAAIRGVRIIHLEEGLDEENALTVLRELDPQGEIGLRGAPENDLRRAVELTRGIPRALELLAGILYENVTLTLSDLLNDSSLFGTEVMNRLVAAGYKHLGRDEQQVIECISVFGKPVNHAAIEFLLQPWFPGLDVKSALRRLASNHFVKINRATGEYNLHPLDMEYAYKMIPG